VNAPPSIAGFPQLSRPTPPSLAESIYSTAAAIALAQRWPGQRLDAAALQRLADDAKLAGEVFSGKGNTE